MFSHTVDYALRAMLVLASGRTSPVSCDDIARTTRVPSGYLSKVMRDLVVAKLVRSFRGPRGGFQIARPAEKITVLDVINAVDPIRRIRSCPAGDEGRRALCPLHRRLDDALATIEDAFGSTTLDALLAGAHPLTCGRSAPRPAPAPTRRWRGGDAAW